MASIASQSEGPTRLYKLIGADVSLLLPSLIITPTGWWIKQYGLDYIYYIVFGSRNVLRKVLYVHWNVKIQSVFFSITYNMRHI